MTKVINASKCIITLCVQGGCRYQSFLRGSCKAHTSAISEMLFSAILQHRLCDTSKKAGTVYSKKTDPVPLILHTQWSKDRKGVRNTPPKLVFSVLLLWPLSYSFGTNLRSKSTIYCLLNIKLLPTNYAKHRCFIQSAAGVLYISVNISH